MLLLELKVCSDLVVQLIGELAVSTVNVEGAHHLLGHLHLWILLHNVVEKGTQNVGIDDNLDVLCNHCRDHLLHAQRHLNMWDTSWSCTKMQSNSVQKQQLATPAFGNSNICRASSAAVCQSLYLSRIGEDESVCVCARRCTSPCSLVPEACDTGICCDYPGPTHS